MLPPVKEFPREQSVSGAEINWREHDFLSESKKVIDGAVPFAKEAGKTVAPLVVAIGGASAGIDLAPNTTYRMLSSTDLHFVLSEGPGAETATTADIYLPANQPLVIRTGSQWRRIDAIQATAAGTLQLVKLVT
jgi:hypothetical protein